MDATGHPHRELRLACGCERSEPWRSLAGTRWEDDSNAADPQVPADASAGKAEKSLQHTPRQHHFAVCAYHDLHAQVDPPDLDHQPLDRVLVLRTERWRPRLVPAHLGRGCQGRSRLDPVLPVPYRSPLVVDAVHAGLHGGDAQEHGGAGLDGGRPHVRDDGLLLLPVQHYRRHDPATADTLPVRPEPLALAALPPETPRRPRSLCPHPPLR
mmetsp:Transcript_45469/g.134572  ORF Transcript_45469/g.134572 Transcript_45469/m.134572 type:complete len:212 (+) Transcript_45469:893-1528(+)